MNIVRCIILFCTSFYTLACPYCAGTDSGKDQYTLYILGAFILLTYIPGYLIYRMIKKNG